MNKFIKSIFNFIMLIGILSMILLVSCNKTESIPGQPTSTIMLINGLATATSTNAHFFLDSQRISNTSLAYGATTNYLVVGSNYSSGTIKNATTNATLISSAIQLQDKLSYSIFLHGTAATPLVLITKDTLSTPSSGKSRVRLVNLGQGIGSNIDLLIRNDYQIAPVAKMAVPNCAFGAASSFVEIDSCTNYSFQIVSSGTNTVKISSSKVTILPNLNYTIMVRGISAGTPALAIQSPINNSVY